MATKKGLSNKERWEKCDRKILEYAREVGCDSFREIARRTEIDKNTVSKHLNRFPESEFYKGRHREKLLKQRYVSEDSGFPFEFDALRKGKNFPQVYRQGAREVGKVFYFATPNTGVIVRETRFFDIAERYQTEFLSRNPYWLYDFFKKALKERLIDERYFSGERSIEEISDEELNQLWKSLFGDVELFILSFTLNLKKLLERLKTSEGKEDLKRVLSTKTQKEIYQEALKHWKQQKPSVVAGLLLKIEKGK